MIDFLEFNMRRIVNDNTTFCASKCHIFENLKADKTLLPAEEK